LSIATIYANRFLCIYLADERARVARLSWRGRLALLANHANGLPAFKLRFAGLTPGLDAAWAWLEAHHPQAMLSEACSPRTAEVYDSPDTRIPRAL
jgi:hypothetical protein